MGIRDFMNESGKHALNEAVNLTRKLTSGGTIKDFLKELFDEFGQEAWVAKEVQHIADKYSMNTRNVSDLVRKLKADNLLDVNGTKTFITDELLKELGVSKDTTSPNKIEVPVVDDKPAETNTTTVKELSIGQLKKLKIPTSKTGDKFETFLQTVTLHMMGDAKGRLLLTGDPGTGKSRTVETMMSLLRMQVITIEAPHTSEESIISIPYLVRRGNDVETGVDQYKGGKDEMSYDVVNAESSLITKLKRTLPIKDAEYNQFLNTNRLLKPYAEEYKEVIEEVSKTYKTVLFLDEFYRCFGGEQMISVDILDPKFKEFVESRI